MKDFGIVYVRADGSYLVNNGTYHVPNNGEFAALWADVNLYAQTNPGKVLPEPEPEPEPEPTLEEARAAAAAALREKRKAVEYGGFVFDGQVWDSTEKDELRLNSMMKMFEITGQLEFPGWKVSDGVYITLTKNMAMGAAMGLMQHYAECFRVEAVKLSQLEGLGSVEAINMWLGFLDNGWPGAAANENV